MKYALVSVMWCCLVPTALAANALVEIESTGNTVLTYRDDDFEVAAWIETETGLTLADEANARFCGNSASSCSKVKSISLRLNSEPIFVPPTVACGLFNLNRASLEREGNLFKLLVQGGDSSEGFEAIVEFNEEGVQRKEVYSKAFPEAGRTVTTFGINIVVE